MKWQRRESPVVGVEAYISGSGCVVMVGREPLGPGGELRWHLSISRRDRYPNWEEIKEARYYFVPDEVTMAMFLPPRAEYVNLHPNCFHLHEFVGNEVIVKL